MRRPRSFAVRTNRRKEAIIMKKALCAALFAAVLLAAAVPVSTVTNGQPDGNRHPYVGIAIQPIPSMPGFFSICSGSALSPTVFLTAAHCFDPAQPVLVSFKSAAPFSLATDFTRGKFFRHPAWCFGCGPGLAGADFHDVAVIELEKPANPGPFAMLPAEGFVDTLPMKTPVDVVGYGVQGFLRGGGQPTEVFLATRYFAPSELVQSNNVQSVEFIKLTANPAQGKGGICFGPDLLGGPLPIILAVNTFVTNGNCAGVTYANRVDLPDILKFITGYLN
jgi:Trypsin